MKDTKLISMLTWHDVTVDNAKDIFLDAKGAPCDSWGFKLEGIKSRDQLFDLVKCMQDAGKETYLEVLSMDKETGLRTAESAVAAGFDHLIGTVYHESIAGIIAGSGVKYAPFIGLDPADTRLRGSVADIVAQAKEIAEKDVVHGSSLSGFRYVSGDPKELITALAAAIRKPLGIAGSVDSYERIGFLKGVPNLASFTIGGAFFEKKFGDTFADQIRAVAEYLRA